MLRCFRNSSQYLAIITHELCMYHFGGVMDGSTKVFCDNQRAVDIANHKHGSLNTALRHVDIY